MPSNEAQLFVTYHIGLQHYPLLQSMPGSEGMSASACSSYVRGECFFCLACFRQPSLVDLGSFYFVSSPSKKLYIYFEQFDINSSLKKLFAIIVRPQCGVTSRLVLARGRKSCHVLYRCWCRSDLIDRALIG